MTDFRDPPRLRHSSDSPPLLAKALAVCRKELPSQNELDDVASSLASIVLSGAMERGHRSVRARRWLSMAGGAAGFKLLLAAALAAASISIVIRRGQIEQRNSALDARPSTPLPKVVSTRATTSSSAPQLVGEGSPARLGDEEKPSISRSRRVASTAPAPTVSNHAHDEVSTPLPVGTASFAEEKSSSEIALLNRAQRALATDPRNALSLTERHAQQFPRGVLAQEREFIAIEALLSLGRSREAASRATRFRADFPGSAHLRRLDMLLGSTGQDGPE